LLDGRTIEAPITADAKAGEPALTQKPVNGGRMNTEVFRQFLDSEDFFLGGHWDPAAEAIQKLRLAERCTSYHFSFRE